MQIKDMNTEQLQDLIRQTVDETLDEYFGDPDEEKEVKESVILSLFVKKALEDSQIGIERF